VVQNRAGALLVAKRIALVAGRVEGHPDGHGFLEPDDGGPRVFLPPAEMREVIHGTAPRCASAAATRAAARWHDRRSARARNRRIVGRLHAGHGVLFLVPEDRRIAHDIVVPQAEVGGAKPARW